MSTKIRTSYYESESRSIQILWPVPGDGAQQVTVASVAQYASTNSSADTPTAPRASATFADPPHVYFERSDGCTCKYTRAEWEKLKREEALSLCAWLSTLADITDAEILGARRAVERT